MLITDYIIELIQYMIKLSRLPSMAHLPQISLKLVCLLVVPHEAAAHPIVSGTIAIESTAIVDCTAPPALVLPIGN